MNMFLSRFRGLLEESDKTQKEICDDLGIRHQKLSNWKTGYCAPIFDDLIILAKYFNVSTDYLLGITDDEGSSRLNTSDMELPADEQELLTNFRTLPREEKVQARSYVRYLADRRTDFTKKA